MALTKRGRVGFQKGDLSSGLGKTWVECISKSKFEAWPWQNGVPAHVESEIRDVALTKRGSSSFSKAKLLV